MAALAIGMCLAGGALLPARAVLIAYEGFDQGNFFDMTGTAGTGGGDATWVGSTWTGSGGSFFSVGQPGTGALGLTYTGLSTLTGASSPPNEFGREEFRNFGTYGGAGSGSFWMSLLIQVPDVTTSSVGVSFFDGGTERNFVGKAASTDWSVAGAGASSSGVSATVGGTVFLLSRYDMTSGVAHHWLNPSATGGDPTDASAWNGPGGTAFTAFTFNRVRIGAFGGTGFIDEVRIGTTAADAGVVPEPTTAVLLLGALGSCLLLRRKA
jgi:hypothetical protein